MALLQEAKQGRNTEAIFDIAGHMMTDPDDMVHKGVRWLLKETYPKRPREVVAFLKPWRGRAPRLLLRYAAEKMTAKDRASVLARDVAHAWKTGVARSGDAARTSACATSLKPNLEQKRR